VVTFHRITPLSALARQFKPPPPCPVEVEVLAMAVMVDSQSDLKKQDVKVQPSSRSLPLFIVTILQGLNDAFFKFNCPVPQFRYMHNVARDVI
jgi:hypothetical protein